MKSAFAFTALVDLWTKKKDVICMQPVAKAFALLYLSLLA